MPHAAPLWIKVRTPQRRCRLYAFPKRDSWRRRAPIGGPRLAAVVCQLPSPGTIPKAFFARAQEASALGKMSTEACLQTIIARSSRPRTARIDGPACVFPSPLSPPSPGSSRLRRTTPRRRSSRGSPSGSVAARATAPATSCCPDSGRTRPADCRRRCTPPDPPPRR